MVLKALLTGSGVQTSSSCRFPSSFYPVVKLLLSVQCGPEMVDQSILDLIAQAKVETDAAKRTDIFNQLQDFAQKDSAFAPFNVPAAQTAYRSTLQGYVRHPQWDFDIALLSRTE